MIDTKFAKHLVKRQVEILQTTVRFLNINAQKLTVEELHDSSDVFNRVMRDAATVMHDIGKLEQALTVLSLSKRDDSENELYRGGISGIDSDDQPQQLTEARQRAAARLFEPLYEEVSTSLAYPSLVSVDEDWSTLDNVFQRYFFFDADHTNRRKLLYIVFHENTDKIKSAAFGGVRLKL
jgi:hypothetical protein